MAHFVQIINGIVTDGIVISNEIVGDKYPESELVGKGFIAKHGYEGQWLQTSYNHNFRKQYAGIGFIYDEVADVFITPQPYSSWTLDNNYDWIPPVPMPLNGKAYRWNEEIGEWEEISIRS